MLVLSERSMALYCPACEKVQHHVFSIFMITKTPYPLQCSCGFTQGHLTRKGNRYEVRLLCPSGDRLRLIYPLKELWTTPLLTFYSPEDGEEMGFFGNAEEVETAVKSWEDGDEAPEDFVNPEIMQQILGRLQELAKTHKITCRCDHPSVGLDVYPDKIELVCSFCGSALLMGATTKKDVDRLLRLKEIVMEPSSYTYLEEWLRPFL